MTDNTLTLSIVLRGRTHHITRQLGNVALVSFGPMSMASVLSRQVEIMLLDLCAKAFLPDDATDAFIGLGEK